MESEDVPRARFGVALVAEESFDAGGFVEKRQRAFDAACKVIGQVRRVDGGLLGDA